MTAREAHRQKLSGLLAGDEAAELESFLLSNSGLPGPRGNLELAHDLADLLAAKAPLAAVRESLKRWRALAAEQAPTGDPREYLCFCGTLAWSADWVRGGGRGGAERGGAGARGGRGGGSREAIAHGLRRAASDPRWRRREAVAMALQRIGEVDPKAMLELLSPWVNGSFLEQRAVAAALAHPPLLGDRAVAGKALSLADRILQRVAEAEPGARKREDFRVLRQGLGYALSVLAAADPERGFALLERWAARRDADVRWILRENLKKKRLAAHAGRLSRLAKALGGA
jgi:hypothetical protein